MAFPPIITFSSDFGSSGPYVGAVKGAILQICPEARIVDISHEISSHNILEAAFNLACSYSYFPAGTVHLAVVDPGVGSKRRGIAVSTERHLFVGPDNGLFTLIYRREKVKQVISIESERALPGNGVAHLSRTGCLRTCGGVARLWRDAGTVGSRSDRLP